MQFSIKKEFRYRQFTSMDSTIINGETANFLNAQSMSVRESAEQFLEKLNREADDLETDVYNDLCMKCKNAIYDPVEICNINNSYVNEVYMLSVTYKIPVFTIKEEENVKKTVDR